MSAILEHFKPPPSASDPPAKTKYWPAPPKGSTGGILQKTESVASSNGSQYPGSPVSRVSFAPLPDLTTRKRRNSITLGVAARSATLRAQRMGPHPPPPRRNGYGPSGPAPGRPRRRAADHYKDDQVIDLGEVAIDAGKKLWRVISRKASMASDSGRPDMHTLNHKAHMHEEMGGPTVGATGHNTEREISVRGFAVPEDDEDEEDEDDEDDDDEDDEDEDEAEEAQHRTEDYVAGVQAMHISAGNITAGDGVEPCHLHPTRLSPPPLSRSETDSSPGASAASTPSMSHEREPPLDTGKDSLF